MVEGKRGNVFGKRERDGDDDIGPAPKKGKVDGNAKKEDIEIDSNIQETLLASAGGTPMPEKEKDMAKVYK